VGQPYLEVSALAHLAVLTRTRSFVHAIERGMEAVELARRNGWTDEQIVYPAYVALANSYVGQGKLEEGERWLEQADRLPRPGGQPTIEMTHYVTRGLLEGARGRDVEALAAFRAALRHAESVVTTQTLKTYVLAFMFETMIRMGDTESVEKAMAAIDEQKVTRGDNQMVIARLRLARG